MPGDVLHGMVGGVVALGKDELQGVGRFLNPEDPVLACNLVGSRADVEESLVAAHVVEDHAVGHSDELLSKAHWRMGTKSALLTSVTPSRKSRVSVTS